MPTENQQTKTTEDSLLTKYFRIFLIVTLYWFVSIFLIFLNKALLSGQSDGNTLDAPLFVTWFQCVVTLVLCFIMTFGAKCFPTLGKLPEFSFHWKIMLKVLPLSIVFVAMIAFNNLCLKYVGVSFYYIGRSLTTVFNVLMTWLLLGERTSRNTLICCAIIVSGFWLGVDQEGVAGTFSITGTIYGLLASLFVSLNAIYTKKVLPVVDQSIWLLGIYNNINACLLFLPIMLLYGEWPVLLAYNGYGNVHFWIMMVSGGLFGFSIGYVAGMQIQTVLATQWYSEMKPFLWWVSNWTVLLGSAAYTRVRQIEMDKNHKATKTANNSNENKNIINT